MTPLTDNPIYKSLNKHYTKHELIQLIMQYHEHIARLLNEDRLKGSMLE
jgi:hypothetical protein